MPALVSINPTALKVVGALFVTLNVKQVVGGRKQSQVRIQCNCCLGTCTLLCFFFFLSSKKRLKTNYIELIPLNEWCSWNQDYDM